MRGARGTAGKGARYALLLIDFFNPDGIVDAPLAKAALSAARRTAVLKTRLGARAQCIYVNDNFGNWRADFAGIVRLCRERGGASSAIAAALEPGEGDWSVLKPRHSAFYGTPLEFMLDELGTRTCVLTGMLADACISITAHDAHVRKFGTWVPSDCIAARMPAHGRAALAQLRRVIDADTRPSNGALPR